MLKLKLNSSIFLIYNIKLNIKHSLREGTSKFVSTRRCAEYRTLMKEGWVLCFENNFQIQVGKLLFSYSITIKAYFHHDSLMPERDFEKGFDTSVH